jgi:hypothetical protein
VHEGFRDGSDVWTGPDVVATGFGPTRRITGIRPANGSFSQLIVGIDRTAPHALRAWDQDGREIREDRTPIIGAAGSGPLTWSGSKVGFGRSWTGRILTLDRQRIEPEGELVWVATERDTAGFARVFAGGRWLLFDPQAPYEWQ